MILSRTLTFLLYSIIRAGEIIGAPSSNNNEALGGLSEVEVEVTEDAETMLMDMRLLQTRVGSVQSFSNKQETVELETLASADSIWPFTQGNASESPLLNKICWGVEDCCPEDAGDACELFCQEGTEIDQSNMKGWQVKGVCRKKWKDFCLEDEECLKGHICQRGLGSLAGACTRDSLCSSMSCGRGRCRAGICTCDYGVAGERCDHSVEAFAFLFYGNSTDNLVSVRVLVQSLRAGGAPQDIIAIIPTNLASDTPEDFLNILREDGVKPIFSEPIPMPPSMDSDPVIHKRWSGVMNKFAVWRLTNYSQVALLDTDMVFSFDTESPEKIFSECKAPLCAVRDGDSRFMNAGVMVIVPSQQRLNHIMHVLSNEQHHFAMPEQSFLTRYCQKKANRMPLQFLDRKWNSCVGGGMLHNVGWESTGYNVLHSCSWTGKPPNMRMCFPGACDNSAEWHTVLVWQFFHMQVDSCINHYEIGKCLSAGLTHACQWCGHYCSSSRIPCSHKLFNETRLRGKDEAPDIAEAAAMEKLARVDVFAKSTPEWNKLPQGSWAWPQVAGYQILIDRFASPTGEHCERLEDYCGGTIPGIRSQIDYLEALGVDGIVLSPIVEQMPHGYHGYWTKDLYSVNPQYGTEDDVKDLIALLHERKMKAVIDVNLNHAGGPKTNASDPFSVSELNPFNDPSHYHSENCSLMHNEDYERGPAFLERCKLYGLPDYNHENPVVWQELMSFVRSHVDKYGFDGIRVDAARHILRAFLDHIPQSGPDVPAFFEVVNGDMKYVSSFATGDYNAVYNYPLYFTLRDIFVPGPKRKPMAELGTWMDKTAEFASGRLMLNFLDNNDLPRFIYKLDGDQLLYHNALLCILGMEGLPVLLYGSEQDQRGVFNWSDPLKVDNWRPPLWHAGYNTSTHTFQLISKVLWLRRRMNGLHGMKQRVLFSDHKVLVFARGPVIFAVTSVGRENPVASQRVLWDNATTDSPVSVWVCNLLAIEPRKDCGIVAPGNLSRIHLHGDPKMYVPTAFVEEYEAQQIEQQALRERSQNQVVASPSVLPFSRWKEMPMPPELNIEFLPRLQRAWRPGDVVLDNDPQFAWHSFPKLPPHLDRWGPPVGQPAPHVVSASLESACFFMDAGERDGLIVVPRGEKSYVLCPYSPEVCAELAEKRVNVAEALKLFVKTSAVIPPGSKPVVHLTVDSPHGLYHTLSNALPAVAPFLPQLKNGEMLAFFQSERSLVAPVLSFLGVSQSALFPPSEPPLAQPFHFCTPKMHFDFSKGPRYPRVQFVPHYLRDFRKALNMPPVSHVPCVARPQGIVLLSPGNSTHLSNEAEVAEGLHSLGRPVTLLRAQATPFQSMLETLSGAALIVGAHGPHMTNMVFAAQSLTVVEIVPQMVMGSVDYHFRDLASSLNFTYVPFGQEAKPTIGEATPSDSYRVDVNRLKSLVASLL